MPMGLPHAGLPQTESLMLVLERIPTPLKSTRELVSPMTGMLYLSAESVMVVWCSE